MTADDLRYLISVAPKWGGMNEERNSRILTELGRQLAEKSRPPPIVFKPVGRNVWLIGPAEAPRTIHSPLKGLRYAYEAIRQKDAKGSVTAASFGGTPTAVRNAITRAADWASDNATSLGFASALYCISVKDDGAVSYRPALHSPVVLTH